MNRFPSKEAAAYYLAGMIDGEGCVDIGGKRVRIKVCDRELIEACVEACTLLQLEYKVAWDISQSQGYSDYHELTLSRRLNLVKVNELLPLQHVGKRDSLDALVKSYVRTQPHKTIVDAFLASGSSGAKVPIVPYSSEERGLRTAAFRAGIKAQRQGEYLLLLRS